MNRTNIKEVRAILRFFKMAATFQPSCIEFVSKWIGAKIFNTVSDSAGHIQTHKQNCIFNVIMPFNRDREDNHNDSNLKLFQAL